MAKVMNKNDLLLLYKMRYGVKCLEASIYYKYKKKDYEEAIEDFDNIQANNNFEEEKKIFERRLRCENIILKELNNNLI